MKYDLGISSGKRPDFYRGIPEDKKLEFAIFALTPGIPHEYVDYLCRIGRVRPRKQFFELVDSLRHIAEPLALENAATITVEDGYNMLLVIRTRGRKYTGRKPHWASIALIQLCRERGWATISAELGVTQRTLVEWRKSSFHPLTLQPLKPSMWEWRGQRPYQLTR